jgi:hypothetical protein
VWRSPWNQADARIPGFLFPFQIAKCGFFRGEPPGGRRVDPLWVTPSLSPLDAVGWRSASGLATRFADHSGTFGMEQG